MILVLIFNNLFIKYPETKKLFEYLIRKETDEDEKTRSIFNLSFAPYFIHIIIQFYAKFSFI